MAGDVRIGVIGTGLKALEYARSWARMPGVRFVAAADVDAKARARLEALCLEAGRERPDGFADYRTMLERCRDGLDMVYVSTPHALHAEQAIAVVESGLDLLLEKPMVTTVAEARGLIAAQARTGSTVVIAFQGGLSRLVNDTRRRAAAGEFGRLVSVAGTIWEGWSSRYAGQWKQRPELSGGGFMFDTGAHMMNTVCLLLGTEFDRVSAFMNNHGKAVDVACAVAARTADGVLVTFNAAGDGPPGCASHLTLFYTDAIVRIDAWGAWREVTRSGAPVVREEDEILDNPLKTFLAIRAGEQENVSTVENGLRFARLWDAIKASAARDGDAIRVADLD